MAFSGTYITTAVSISAGLPSTNNAAGFNALTFTTIIGCMMWGETGDMSEDISDMGLDGRKFHLSGGLDGGLIQFKFRTDLLDAGQILMKSLNNLTTNCSVKLLEPNNAKEWSTGLIANIRALPREATAYQGFTGEFRVNTAGVIG